MGSKHKESKWSQAVDLLYLGVPGAIVHEMLEISYEYAKEIERREGGKLKLYLEDKAIEVIEYLWEGKSVDWIVEQVEMCEGFVLEWKSHWMHSEDLIKDAVVPKTLLQAKRP